MSPDESSNGNKKLKLQNDVDTTHSFLPRDYQIEILEMAKKENTIACLGTGTGKTFIAVMLIREMAGNVRLPFDNNSSEGGKRIFFLVPTVPLVMQQAKTISNHTDLKVGKFYGEMNVDSWNNVKWIEEFMKHEVLVMTAEIFRIIVDHNFISLTKIQLLVIDECHYANGSHPYNEAMKRFVSLGDEEMPRIFGLSASLLNGKCKPTQVGKHMHSLERALRAKITTCNENSEIVKYGTDPKEYIIHYRKHDMTSSFLNEKINDLNKQKKLLEESVNKGSQSFQNEDVLFFNKPIKAISCLKTLLESLGMWFAVKAADIFVKELNILNEKAISQEHKYFFKEMKDFLLKFQKSCEGSSLNSSFNYENIPNKLQRLIQTFKAIKDSPRFKGQEVEKMDDDPPTPISNLKSKKNNGEMLFSCIIFVEQRVTAYVLCEWLKEFKKVNPTYEFVQPEFIVGHGSVGSSETSMSEKIQRKKLKKFRKEECNVLIATRVLEEGMDIRQCNTVIRFDLPKNYCSYVQSRGRARAENSIYCLFVEETNEAATFVDDLCTFKTIENLLASKCKNKEVDMEDDEDISGCDEIRPYMPFGPMGARITMSASISLINRYCSNLPTDMATRLKPQWRVYPVDPDNIETAYKCWLKMPINSRLRDEIESDTMRRKKLAKMSAALIACKKLDEIGELNKHLVPISTLVEDALAEELAELEDEEEAEDGSSAQPGTNRRRQVYVKKTPEVLKNYIPQKSVKCFMHIIEMNLVEPLPGILNPRNRPIIDPADSPRGLALLSMKQIPSISNFRVFTKSGKIEIKIQVFKAPVILSEQDVQSIAKFHQFTFSEALWLKKSYTFKPDLAPASYYIVPTMKDKENQFKIDFDFLHTTLSSTYQCEVKKTKSTCSKTIFREHLFQDAVVLRSYQIDLWENERPSFHHVTSIRHDLTPLSPLDENKPQGMNFKEYYKKKYNVDITDDTQPMVETVQHGSLHLWKPLYVSPKETFEDAGELSSTKMRHKTYREYLVPELCIVHPFPSSFFKKVICLPTILYRLNGLLLAEEIRQKVAHDASVGIADGQSWPPFLLESSDKPLRQHLHMKGLLRVPVPDRQIVPVDIVKDTDGCTIKSFEAKVDLSRCTGPSPSLILQALTAKGSGDEFDLERLEMIGDSFLKFVMSVKIYFKHKNFDEGKMTKLRSGLIQNKRLYQQAKRHNLGESLITKAFSCKNTWLPPCYAVEESVDKNTLVVKTKAEKVKKGESGIESYLHCYFTKQVISDKCIADSVEALIGAYLLASGQTGALKFMHWFGLKPLMNENPCEADFICWPPPPLSPIIGKPENLQFRLNYLFNGLERFEEKINYKFHNKAYLLQAFTHPSYYPNDITDCYQRLEFLGDAVLDYLVTRQLYEDPRDHSPGELTDLRSAMVNNAYFASLAVKFEYNEFLKTYSPGLFRQVDNYVKLLKESEPFKFFVENGYMLEETECFELEEVEVPKSLGDIFESVAGAVYLDSEMSLDAVWKICYPMMKPAMEHLCEHVPKSPVRELYELANTEDVFSDAVIKEGKAYIVANLQGKKFHGVGPNKKVAKRSASKRALAYVKSLTQ